MKGNLIMSKTKPVIDFYAESVKQIHDFANTKGMAVKGVIFIPELYEKGSEFVMAWLRNDEFKSNFSDDPVPYYAFLVRECFYGGVAYADQWHKNSERIKDGSFDELISKANVMTMTEPALKRFGKTREEWDEYGAELFALWAAIHEPYWKLKDCREYTFNLFIAFFQLGVSTLLERFGY